MSTASEQSGEQSGAGDAPGTGAVVVFIDGWNLHRACERAFDHGQIHPLLLGRELAGNRPLGGVRYYMGMPDPRIEESGGKERQRQIDFMAKTGVVTVTRKLRYRWEWKLDKWSLPHPRDHEGETRKGDATARLQGREKGVDVSLALDAFSAAQRKEVAAIVIVSADSDLEIVATALGESSKARRNAGVRVENAIPNGIGKKIINRSYDWSHQIDAAMFARIRDDLDYTKPIKKKGRDRALKRMLLA